MNINKKKIAEITLVVLNKKLWKNISLDEIKKKSKIKSFDRIINDKKDILKILNHYFDYKLSKKSNNIEVSSNKDMLFEVLMLRFDILQIYRKQIISIFNSFKKKPSELFFLMPDLLDSIILMLGYAKFSSTGVIGQIKIKGVLLIYLFSFCVWIKDDSSSLDKTMIALDNYLNKADKFLKFVK